MIEKIQATAFLFFAASFVVVYVLLVKPSRFVFVAVTVSALLVSLAILFATTLLRIWG